MIGYLQQRQWPWIQVSGYISLIHLGKATPNHESDTEIHYSSTISLLGLYHSQRQRTSSTHTGKAGLRSISSTRPGPWSLIDPTSVGRHRWLHSYRLLNNALTQTQRRKCASPWSFVKADEWRESSQLLLDNPANWRHTEVKTLSRW